MEDDDCCAKYQIKNTIWKEKLHLWCLLLPCCQLQVARLLLWGSKSILIVSFKMVRSQQISVAIFLPTILNIRYSSLCIVRKYLHLVAECQHRYSRRLQNSFMILWIVIRHEKIYVDNDRHPILIGGNDGLVYIRNNINEKLWWRKSISL